MVSTIKATLIIREWVIEPRFLSCSRRAAAVGRNRQGSRSGLAWRRKSELCQPPQAGVQHDSSTTHSIDAKTARPRGTTPSLALQHPQHRPTLSGDASSKPRRTGHGRQPAIALQPPDTPSCFMVRTARHSLIQLGTGEEAAVRGRLRHAAPASYAGAACAGCVPQHAGRRLEVSVRVRSRATAAFPCL